MRLTLRTLLAYLDGNLEPDDAEDIGKKIAESEFATKLVHTIRDCTQRPRLGAPPLLGRGLGADPNTVAEYLEYRLADERVPEFERICLESEVNLAEVASCHQILTLVLGEPAEFDPHVRERLYALAAQADAPPLQSEAIRQAVAAPVAAPPSTAVPPVVRRPKPEVPEYLRENRWSIWPVAAMVVVAASLTFAGLFFFGPAPFRERVTALVTPPSEQAGPAEKQNQPEKAAEEAAAPDGAAPAAGVPREGSAPSDTTTPPTDATSQPGTATPAAEPGSKAPPEPAGETPPEPAEPAPQEPAPGTTDPTLARPAAEPVMEDDAAAAPLPPEPGAADSARPAPLPAADSGGKTAAPMPLEGTPAEAATAPAETPPPGDERRAPAEGFGRFFSTKREVLLKFDPSKGEWLRLPARAPLDKGDHLMSLPVFQPVITLSSNIQIQADGAAEFELVGWDDNGTPILSVLYGKLLMATVGRAGNALRLQIDGQEPLLTFVDPESTLAIEVRHELPPGKNPESGPAPLVAEVYATSGVIRITKPDAAPTELQAPALLSLAPGADDKPREGQFPAWVTGDVQSDADRRAASDVDANLVPDKPVGLQLRELLDPKHKLFRRREVQTLAIRSLANLGDFEPSLNALNEADLKNAWPAVRSELKAAVARSPETAARVRSTLEKKRGEADGRALYRMLWGYSTTDLQTGADRDLIDALGRNDALDFRVLAILNLQELTGGANHGYYPDDTEFKRKGPYNNWKGRVGKLVPRSPASATPRARPTTPAGQ